MTTTDTVRAIVALATLPALGEPLEGGTFAGIITRADGTHSAVVLLPEKGTELTWKQAKEWAAGLDAELPSRPVAALLFANVKQQLEPRWHWTSDEDGASYAWSCYFLYGYQGNGPKSYEGCAVAVRMIPLA